MSASDPMTAIGAYMDGDAFARHLGIVRDELTPSRCVCRMALRGEFLNGAGMAHGGAVFALADYAGACVAVAQGCPAPTVNASITYMAAASQGTLTATAQRVRSGKTLVHVRVDVVDDRERLVATYSATAFRLTDARWPHTKEQNAE